MLKVGGAISLEGSIGTSIKGTITNTTFGIGTMA
jgi:hypothetical protein